MTRRPCLAALLLVVAATAGCTASGGSISRVGGTPAPVVDPEVSASATRATATPTPRPSPVSAGSARTLQLPGLVREAIIASFATGSGLERTDVAGISPATGYYGYMPSTGLYWAVASFDPTQSWEAKVDAAPGGDIAYAFNGGPWVFSHQRGKGWVYVGRTVGRVCAPLVPAQMLAAWGLGGDC